MVAILGFVSFAMDSGLIVMEKTGMQNAADAAALAAAQEITAAIQSSNGQPVVDSTTIAAARAMALLR